ncbi:hypothetical protein FA13DRAFT_161598 [Coprinellus micaceus]|uniref:Secreted protein n=1 Tax=Coprinellus micaceus TaxID=71717 RepID=A0A4Y7THD0_COPMI|nr:hypothetical protein FA13DRAFT_161598 [Coprinellus micaceus]
MFDRCLRTSLATRHHVVHSLLLLLCSIAGPSTMLQPFPSLVQHRTPASVAPANPKTLNSHYSSVRIQHLQFSVQRQANLAGILLNPKTRTAVPTNQSLHYTFSEVLRWGKSECVLLPLLTAIPHAPVETRRPDTPNSSRSEKNTFPGTALCIYGTRRYRRLAEHRVQCAHPVLAPTCN